MTIVEAVRLALKTDGYIVLRYQDTQFPTMGGREVKLKPLRDARFEICDMDNTVRVYEKDVTLEAGTPEVLCFDGFSITDDHWAVLDGENNVVPPQYEEADVAERIRMLDERVCRCTARIESVWEAFKRASFYLCLIYAVCVIVLAAYWLRQLFT